MPTAADYMNRCFELAQLGAGHVAPNPMVGAVLVYNGRIIGEGYHQQYGQAHAEVNCINSVSTDDQHLIEKSTIYVSLEPCAHFGKTPPCCDLIIRHKIPAVVVGCRDSYGEVNGKGIQKLLAAGVDVNVGELDYDALDLNRRFFTFHQKQRPYIILKWAQSSNGLVGGADDDRVLISNEQTNRLVHKWRTEEASILVGTNTALKDNPSLTARLWPGNNPVRLVIDNNLRLPASLHLFDQSVKTIVFNQQKDQSEVNLEFVKLDPTDNIASILNWLHKNAIQSILVEGGPSLLQSFIDAGLWDEARVIKSSGVIINKGIAAPILNRARFHHEETVLSDTISYYRSATPA